MAEHLSGGNDAVALLGNTIATGAILFVLIAMLAPISGAHMNPAVSLVAAWRGELGWGEAGAYALAQLGCGILGAWAAHLMFDLPALQLSVKARTGQKAKALFHPIRVALTGRAEGPELDLAIPAIDGGADLPGDAGIPKILGCRERAAAFVEALEGAS